VIQDVKRDIAEFFKLPLEARKVHAQLPDGLEGYGQVFVFSETQKLDWSDMLYLMLRPVESRDMRFWPVQPPSFRSPLMMCAGRSPAAHSVSPICWLLQGANLSVYRESGYVCRSSVDRYSAEAAKVVSCLLRFMAVDMGVEPERLLELFGGQPQTMKVTYYPPCRQAGQVIGLSPHTDACAMTLLLHVNDVQGLQIRRGDGKWLAVEPLDGALTVFVGDVIEESTANYVIPY
jgi:isopenicillin N synthase-like dioxygenase